MKETAALTAAGFTVSGGRAEVEIGEGKILCKVLGKDPFMVRSGNDSYKYTDEKDPEVKLACAEYIEEYKVCISQDEAPVQDASFEEVEHPPEEVPQEAPRDSLREKVNSARNPTQVSKPARSIQQRPSRTIKGLTPRLAECGKIKIGGKGEEKTYKYGKKMRLPEKFDHFVVTGMAKNENDDFIPDPVIMDILGESPTVIPVRLPYDDPSLNFPTSYACYETAACKCRGDGEIAVTAEGETIECNPETCPNYAAKKCKATGVLSVMLDDAPRVGGVYKLRTTGWNTINNITASMEFIRGLTNGILAGLPLDLTLTPKYTTIPGSGQRTVIYMVNLEYRGNFAAMASAIQGTLETREKMKYSIEDFERLALAEIDAPEDPEEARDIQEEFFPEVAA